MVWSFFKNFEPDIDLIFERKEKNLAFIFRSQKGGFPKCTFSGPKLNWRVLVWYLHHWLKALISFGLPAGANALCGLDYRYHIKQSKSTNFFTTFYCGSNKLINKCSQWSVETKPVSLPPLAGLRT